jgi:hypothetical protein
MSEISQAEFSIFQHPEVEGIWRCEHPDLARELDGFDEAAFLDTLPFENPTLVFLSNHRAALPLLKNGCTETAWIARHWKRHASSRK